MSRNQCDHAILRIGMATGHTLKLRKRLAELNPPAVPAAAAPVCAAELGVAQSGQASGTSQNFEKRVSFGQVEQNGAAGSLLDGHYDEEEAANSFKEAVAAWRGGGDAGAQQATPAESSAAAPQRAPGSFWWGYLKESLFSTSIFVCPSLAPL
jgi:hypothetical protein